MKTILSMLAICIWLISAIPATADVTIGLPANSANCEPFGCNYVGDYQQVYTSSQFPGTVTITEIRFFNTIFDSGVTTMNSGNWDIYLSTTTADWNTLAVDYSQNIGPDNTEVFSGNLYQTWVFGNTLSIPLSTPFTYDPSKGNLLMDVRADNNSTGHNYAIFFDAKSGTQIMSRGLGGSYVDYGYGLVTEFVTSPVLQAVTIDIKPGDNTNSINPKSKGKIPVAILSTDEFDAPNMVNQDSLTFGSTGEEDSLAFCNNPEDVNGDGLKDLVCHFYTQSTGFQCGDTEAILKGKTVAGISIEGNDSIKIGPCK
jgi:hypothetical protein